MILATRILAVLGVAALAGARPVPQDEAAAPSANPVVAEGRGGLVVRARELEELLLERHSYDGEGQALFQLFFKSRLLEALAVEKGVHVSKAAVAARWEELDRRSRASGGGGIVAQMREQGLGVEELRDFLRLALVQEELTRRALGLGPKDPLTGTQQEVWLQGEFQKRGVEKYPPPWEDGLIAECGDVRVATTEFASFLSARLAPQKVQEAAWHLLLQQALERKLPDLAPAALERAIETEIDRRRRIHESEQPGISFVQRLGAQGQTLDSLRRDPSVSIAALTRAFVDRKYGEEGLRKVYEEERELFEGRYGEAVETSLLLLVAGQFANELVPRTFEEADRELLELKERAGDAADFHALVAQFTEDPKGRERNGLLGWVTRSDPRVPETIREAVFDFLGTGGKVPATGIALGPVRLTTGCALLWLSAVRPSPPWERMREHVHEELRRRLVEEAMPFDSVQRKDP